MILILLYVVIILQSLVILFGLYRYNNIQKLITSYKNIGTGRYGFYKYTEGYLYSAYIYVKEIDRYNNGYSKIMIDRIEPCGNYKDESITYAKNNFVSIILTNKINWLEGEENIKKIRKEKLKSIIKK